ncbi:hypothetical protein PGTUg99_027575 [Puccinia graminis f. sp. tritici]|uniref:Uncharacterized protein n=1 Tax=Puccinia graminis f. sp. tritici TaxID=56615 RepID=A0A5B0Q8U4_PUCGR|nr:hypothetical protein PGTUg99_027575 [Puccinia graminis f. sp. tritici]
MILLRFVEGEGTRTSHQLFRFELSPQCDSPEYFVEQSQVESQTKRHNRLRTSSNQVQLRSKSVRWQQLRVTELFTASSVAFNLVEHVCPGWRAWWPARLSD